MHMIVLFLSFCLIPIASEALAEDTKAPAQLLGQRSARDTAQKPEEEKLDKLAPSAARKNNSDVSVGDSTSDDGTSRVQNSDRFQDTRGARNPDVLDRLTNPSVR